MFCLPGQLLAEQQQQQQVQSTLTQVRVLAEGGATQLALRMTEKYQPAEYQPAIDQEADWVVWEKQRLAIYRLQSDWEAIRERVAGYSTQLPNEFRLWAQLVAAEASLDAAEVERAQADLRRLLWEMQADEASRTRAQRLMIRSYLQQDNIADAQTALLRYKQDQRSNNPAWQLLHARVLLRADNPKAAYDVLLGNQSYAGRLMRLLAALRTGKHNPSKIMHQAQALAVRTRQKPALAQLAWSIVAEAASKDMAVAKAVEGKTVAKATKGKSATKAAKGKSKTKSKTKAETAEAKRLRAYMQGVEWVLSLPPAAPDARGLFAFSADDLWQAYLAMAEDIGNRQSLLVGDDAAWLKYTEGLERDDADLARAVYALVAQKGQLAELQQQAHQKLIEALLVDGRERAVHALYMESTIYPKIESLPKAVRHTLAEHALNSFDIKLASQLIQGLDKPDGDSDPSWWMLRQARIMVYAGDVETALDKLGSLLVKRKTLEEDFVGPYLQVLFDLQNIERHQEALYLLEQVFTRIQNERTRREILFWMADSKRALGYHQEAAELYLRSAIYQETLGGDMWGQSARFHAAQTLTDAGLIEDARQVYRRLWQQSDDAKQRALIERETQQLWLRQQSPTKP